MLRESLKDFLNNAGTACLIRATSHLCTNLYLGTLSMFTTAKTRTGKRYQKVYLDSLSVWQ